MSFAPPTFSDFVIFPWVLLLKISPPTLANVLPTLKSADNPDIPTPLQRHCSIVHASWCFCCTQHAKPYLSWPLRNVYILVITQYSAFPRECTQTSKQTHKWMDTTQHISLSYAVDKISRRLIFVPISTKLTKRDIELPFVCLSAQPD